MALDYRLGKIMDITRKKNNTFLLTVSFCNGYECEEYTEIMETDICHFEIGNMIRVYYKNDKIEMAFHEEEIDADEFCELVNRIPFLSEEELLGYHEILIGRNLL